MKILVTGDKGYIGTVLVPMLNSAGFDVLGLDTDYFERCTFSGQVPENASIRKDSRDIIIEDLAACDAVIHLAGLSNDPMGDYRPETPK